MEADDGWWMVDGGWHQMGESGLEGKRSKARRGARGVVGGPRISLLVTDDRLNCSLIAAYNLRAGC